MRFDGDPHFYSAHHGLEDEFRWYRNLAGTLGPLRRATALLDYVPKLAQRVGHMVFVAAQKP